MSERESARESERERESTRNIERERERMRRKREGKKNVCGVRRLWYAKCTGYGYSSCSSHDYATVIHQYCQENDDVGMMSGGMMIRAWE